MREGCVISSAPRSPRRWQEARSSSRMARASARRPSRTAASPCGSSAAKRRRMRSMAQKRLTAVGRVTRICSHTPSRSRRSAAPSAVERRTPSAIPKAAVTPMAGAPRTAMSRMAAATSAGCRQRRYDSSCGSRRWSISTTDSSSHTTVRTTRGLRNIHPNPEAPAGRSRARVDTARTIKEGRVMIPVDAALHIVLKHTPSLGAEEVPLTEALGRVLAEDVSTDSDLPPFDRSAMDGYAVRAADVAQAPVVLDVAGQIRAGQWPDQPLPPGQAVQVMTGAPVPAGATAVQPVEKTRAIDGGRRVEILEPVPTGAHIARQGAEGHAGDEVLARGCVVDPASVAVLAAVGKGRVLVGRRPTVSVLVTGDELVDVWDAPTRG